MGGSYLGQEGVGGTTWGSTLSTSSLTAAALTGGPSITVPLAGDYDFSGQASTYNSAGDSLASIFISTSTGASWTAGDAISYGYTSYQALTMNCHKKLTGLAANTTVSMYYAVSNVSYPASFYNRNLWARPIRVSA